VCTDSTFVITCVQYSTIEIPIWKRGDLLKARTGDGRKKPTRMLLRDCSSGENCHCMTQAEDTFSGSRMIIQEANPGISLWKEDLGYHL